MYFSTLLPYVFALYLCLCVVLVVSVLYPDMSPRLCPGTFSVPCPRLPDVPVMFRVPMLAPVSGFPSLASSPQPLPCEVDRLVYLIR
jgi:hypothetical protein